MSSLGSGRRWGATKRFGKRGCRCPVKRKGQLLKKQNERGVSNLNILSKETGVDNVSPGEEES